MVSLTLTCTGCLAFRLSCSLALLLAAPWQTAGPCLPLLQLPKGFSLNLHLESVSFPTSQLLTASFPHYRASSQGLLGNTTGLHTGPCGFYRAQKCKWSQDHVQSEHIDFGLIVDNRRHIFFFKKKEMSMQCTSDFVGSRPQKCQKALNC